MKSYSKQSACSYLAQTQQWEDGLPSCLVEHWQKGKGVDRPFNLHIQFDHLTKDGMQWWGHEWCPAVDKVPSWVMRWIVVLGQRWSWLEFCEVGRSHSSVYLCLPGAFQNIMWLKCGVRASGRLWKWPYQAINIGDLLILKSPFAQSVCCIWVLTKLYDISSKVELSWDINTALKEY